MDGSNLCSGQTDLAAPHHETAEAYRHVITHLGRYRVIVCKDGMQWIIQRSEKGTMGRVWRGVRCVTCKTALNRLWCSFGCEPCPKIEALPTSFRMAAK